MTDEKEWRKFMDKNWQDLKNSRLNDVASSSDYLTSTHDLFNKISSTGKSVSSTSKRIKTHDQRQAVKAKATEKHARKLIREVNDTKSDIAVMGARRKEIAAKTNPSDAEAREHLEISKKMEKTLIERQKQLEKDWGNS